MSTKRKTYSAEFKAKVVLEVLEGNETINQIASKYELSTYSKRIPIYPKFVLTPHL